MATHDVMAALCRTRRGMDMINDLRAYAVEREIRLCGYHDDGGSIAQSGELDRVFAMRLDDGRTVKEHAEERAQGSRMDVDYIDTFMGVLEGVEKLI